MNYTAILRNHARNRPTHLAVADPTSGIAYAQFDALVDAAAVRLAGEGVRQGDVVAVAIGDRVEYLLALFAVLRVGAVFFGVTQAATAEALRGELEQFEARWLLTDAERDVPSAVRTIGVDAAWRNAGPLSSLPFDMPHDPALPAYIVQTSGTVSGKPRGVALTHGDLAQRLRSSQTSMGYGPWDRFASLVPLSFNVGRIHMMQTLQTGGTVLILPPSAPTSSVPELVSKNAVTWMFLTPFHLRRLMQRFAQAERPVLGGLHQLVVASSALSAQERAAARRLLSPNLIEQYGTAQCGLHSISTPADQARAPDAVGRIIVGSEAQIVDADDRPLAPGAIGEIRLRGPGFATGYWKDPEASARNFRDGWFYPGDLAAIDADGYLHLKGRVDDMFVHDGINVYPEEIEAVLALHPQVADVAVVGQRTDAGQEIPVAVLVVRSPLTQEELHGFCAPRLSDVKRPRAFYFIPELPKNDLGKTIRRQLRAALPVLVSANAKPLPRA
ncbi:MAG: class I adenylate-forming enzyme family protein [Reyranellaceae bacterium]